VLFNYQLEAERPTTGGSANVIWRRLDDERSQQRHGGRKSNDWRNNQRKAEWSNQKEFQSEYLGTRVHLG